MREIGKVLRICFLISFEKANTFIISTIIYFSILKGFLEVGDLLSSKLNEHHVNLISDKI